MIELLLALALQAAPVQPATDPRPAEWPDPEREMPMGDALVSDESPTEARLMMARFATCVADRSPEKVADVLMRDFRTTEYRNGLRNLARANEGCARSTGLRGSLRMANLPFAAALAEVMIKRNPDPLRSRLAMAATGEALETYAPTDAIAMCVARSIPDEVAALLSSEPGSEGEFVAIKAVQLVAGMCSRGEKLEISTTGLRSIVATATYRLLAAQES